MVRDAMRESWLFVLDPDDNSRSVIPSNAGDASADLSRMQEADLTPHDQEIQMGRRKKTNPKTMSSDADRLTMLARVNAGELDNSAAAKALGLTPGVWGLWRARYAKSQGGAAKAKAPKREAKPKAAKRAASKPTPGKRGRKADPTETARRAAVLRRVNAGELSNNEAADELGLRLGTWSVWKGNYIKRTGAKTTSRRGRPPGSKNGAQPVARRPGRPAKVAASPGALADLVAQLQSIERFQEGLRERLRELAEFVEANAPE